MTRPLKILNLVARLNIGGPAVHVTLVTARMGAPAYESVLVSGSIAAGEGDMSDYARERGVEPVIVPELGRELHPLRDVITLWKLYRYMRRFRPDVVHTYTAKAGAVGRLAAKLAGVPVVVHTFHGHVFRGYFDRFRTSLFIGIERMAARWSDVIITLSPELRRELVEIYRIAPADRVVVLPNGLDLEALARTPRRHGAFRRELGIPAEAPLVGIIGRLVPVKNHALFLEAAARVRRERPDAHFVVVGDGELREELEARIPALRLRDHVTIVGWRRNLSTIYSDLDVLVLTSVNEGTPLTVIEALTAGVPVVATAVGGVPDLLEHGRLGRLVPPGDATAVAAAIVDTLREPTEPSPIRATIAERYGIDRLVRDLDRLYRRILAEKRGQGAGES
ncbi:MAG: glycosyltransferase family 4 protein [Candidatus Binatia bacterium]